MIRPSPRQWVAGSLVLLLFVAAALYLLTRDAQEGEAHAERAAVSEKQKAQTALAALEAQCDVGIRSACDQLKGIEDQPDPDDPEAQEAEIQEPEVQEPERQDPEIQNAEIPDPERQDPEGDDPEVQDDEIDDPEVQDQEEQDSEVDDPDPDDPERQDDEIQDAEVQDPEIDDPDPNSLLNYVDACNPAEGHYVSDVGFTFDGTTLTLTCTTIPLPPNVVPPTP